MPAFDYSALETELTVKLKERSYRVEEPSARLLARIARLASAEPKELEEAAARLEETLREMIPGVTETDLRFLLIPRVLAGFLRDLSGNAPRG